MLHSINQLGFSDEQLLETAKIFAGSGNDAELPDPVRFVRSVARLLRNCEEQLGTVGTEPSVFLLHPQLSNAIPSGHANRYRMIDNGRTPINGKLWLVGPPVASGWAVQLSYDEDDDIFQQVADKYGLGTAPAVIYDPRTGPDRLRFYAEGLDNADKRAIVALPRGVVTFQQVKKWIDHVYLKDLVTPDAQMDTGKLWEDADKWWAKSLAEQTIQMYLKIGLSVAFPHCEIRPEQPGVVGRLDLEIEESDKFSPGELVRHVLIELKVLRSYGSGGGLHSPGKTNKWIDEGVDQAFAYARDRNAREAALCCFDMRKTNVGGACFDHVREKAATLGVSLEVWYLFASAKAYRATLPTLESNAE